MAEHDAAPALVKFALAVYGTEGVGGACLFLQDRFDLDVNMLLFASFVGAVRGETLTARNVEAAHRRVDAWHAEVVRPLRAVRKALKFGPSPAPDDRTTKLRSKIQQIEIESEVIELAELGAVDWLSEAPRAIGSAHQRAAAAMETLIAGPVDISSLPDDVRDAIATVAAAAAEHGSASNA